MTLNWHNRTSLNDDSVLSTERCELLKTCFFAAGKPKTDPWQMCPYGPPSYKLRIRPSPLSQGSPTCTRTQDTADVTQVSPLHAWTPRKELCICRGRAIAQVVTRRLPTAAARVRAGDRSCGICGGQSGTWAGFLRLLRFPLLICTPPIAPRPSSSIIWGWYNTPNSGRSTKWTQSHPMRKQDMCLYMKLAAIMKEQLL
jgi:hypothetical protein